MLLPVVRGYQRLRYNRGVAGFRDSAGTGT